jgi:hypothetical protein
LKKKTFRLAGEADAIEPEERRNLARELILEGFEAEKAGRQARVTFRGLVAYGQAVLAYVEAVFRIMARYRVKTFAAIVDPAAPRPADGSQLRRDFVPV